MSVKERLRLPNPQGVVAEITTFIKENVERFKAQGAIFGLSGGVDSSLVAHLLSRALPQEKILALYMGERDSHPESRIHARLVARTLGIELKEINIAPILRKIGVYSLEPSPLFFPRSFQEKYTRGKYLEFSEERETAFLKSLKGGEGIPQLMKGNAYLRIKHRIRAVLLYFYGEQLNYIVVGCVNKTERLIGYFVKYGDSASEIAPIADLYKTQVKALARSLGVPEGIREKPPSPDLAPGLTDEFVLQMPYERIDVILYALEKGLTEELLEEGFSQKEIDYVRTLNALSEHMREAPLYPQLRAS